MKNLKVVTIATILTVLIIALCGGMMTANAETSTKVAVVTGWEQIEETTEKIITVIAEDGNVWEFFDNEVYWSIGDVIVITLQDEELVINAVRIDHLDGRDLFNWLDRVNQ